MSDAFEAVIKIDQNFVERQTADEHDAFTIDCFGVFTDTALLRDQCQHITDRIRRNMNRCVNHGFFDELDLSGIREVDRIVHFDLFAVCLCDMINYTRISGNHIEIILAADTLLDDLHVKQTEETTTKAEAKGDGVFRLVNEGSVVKTKFTHARLELVVVARIDGVNTTKNHGADLFVAG